MAKYARMMGNYIATNVDEQLLAAYLYLGANGGTTIDGTDPLEQAFRIAHYSSIRQKDQIRNARLFYETSRQRSLDYSQQCIQVRQFKNKFRHSCGLTVCNIGVHLAV